MSSLRAVSDGDLASLRLRITKLADTAEWRALADFMIEQREDIFKVLADEHTAGEQLKFAQGELKQVNRDILLVERFLAAIAKEQERRQRKEDRR